MKPHPHDIAFQKVKTYDPLFYRHQNLKMVLDLSPYDILHHVDLVVCVDQSTLGLEAMLFNKPVLFLKNEGQNPVYVTDYFDEMGRICSSDPIVLAEMAVDLLSDHGIYCNENEKVRNDFVSSRYPVKASMKTMLELLKDITGASFSHPSNQHFSG
ncbi:hypothetical protein AN963_02715 [Brevibacillus choshinensis]|uniref:UDP-N-acetylglucosamine 2-epimerase domain-containing protein n=1 Tax=Brevibacillus choshinensis TaxID=54911 RepID=A0ABR5NB15_BRECH|nr:hypothetical protein AN963_02715 [Brevibacillus choshinensis]